jgi:hypothetical protein
MNEFLLALWAMTAGHHQWEMPAKEPAAIVRPLESLDSVHELSAGERHELRIAAERTARCATGNLRPDADYGWYVPEQKTTGRCARLAVTGSGDPHGPVINDK